MQIKDWTRVSKRKPALRASGWYLRCVEGICADLWIKTNPWRRSLLSSFFAYLIKMYEDEIGVEEKQRGKEWKRNLIVRYEHKPTHTNGGKNGFIRGVNSSAFQKFSPVICALRVINCVSACAHVLEGAGQSHVITKPHRWEYMWEDHKGISTAVCAASTPYLVLQGFYSASLAKFPEQCVHPVDLAWKSLSKHSGLFVSCCSGRFFSTILKLSSCCHSGVYIKTRKKTKKNIFAWSFCNSSWCLEPPVPHPNPLSICNKLILNKPSWDVSNK